MDRTLKKGYVKGVKAQVEKETTYDLTLNGCLDKRLETGATGPRPSTAFSFHSPVFPRFLLPGAVPEARSGIRRLLAALIAGLPSSLYTRTEVMRPPNSADVLSP